VTEPGLFSDITLNRGALCGISNNRKLHAGHKHRTR